MSTLQQSWREFRQEELTMSRYGLGTAFIRSLLYGMVGYVVCGIMIMLLMPKYPDEVQSMYSIFLITGISIVGAYMVIVFAWLGVFIGFGLVYIGLGLVGLLIAYLFKRQRAYAKRLDAAYVKDEPCLAFVSKKFGKPR